MGFSAPYPDMTGFWLCPDGRPIKLPEMDLFKWTCYHLGYVMSHMRAFGLDAKRYIGPFTREIKEIEGYANNWKTGWDNGWEPSNLKDVVSYFDRNNESVEDTHTGALIMANAMENGFIRMRKYVVSGYNNYWVIGFIGSMDSVKSNLANMVKGDPRLMAERGDFILTECKAGNPWFDDGKRFSIEGLLHGEDGGVVSGDALGVIRKWQNELHTKAGTRESDVLKKQRSPGISSADRVNRFGDIKTRQLAMVSENVDLRFESFLGRLRNGENDSLIESILSGYRAIYESDEVLVRGKSHGFDKLSLYSDGELVSELTYSVSPITTYTTEKGRDPDDYVNIEWMETDSRHRRRGYGSRLVAALREAYPDKKLIASWGNDSAGILSKSGVVNPHLA